MTTCRRCQGPLSPLARYGVCTRNADCLRAARRFADRKRRPPSDRACKHCGGPLLRNAKFGYCSRSDECEALRRNVAKQAWYAAARPVILAQRRARYWLDPERFRARSRNRYRALKRIGVVGKL